MLAAERAAPHVKKASKQANDEGQSHPYPTNQSLALTGACHNRRGLVCREYPYNSLELVFLCCRLRCTTSMIRHAYCRPAKINARRGQSILIWDHI